MRLCLATSLLTALALPGAAQAHAILIESQPAVRGVAAPGPARLVLRFNSRIDQARSRLALRRDGVDHVLPLAQGGAEDVLAAQADLAPGAYVLRWQVLAVDGHITRGDVPFTVRPGPVAMAPLAPSSTSHMAGAGAPVVQTPAPPAATVPAAAPLAPPSDAPAEQAPAAAH